MRRECFLPNASVKQKVGILVLKLVLRYIQKRYGTGEEHILGKIGVPGGQSFAQGVQNAALQSAGMVARDPHFSGDPVGGTKADPGDLVA